MYRKQIQLVFIVFLIALTSSAVYSTDYELRSPDKDIKVVITVNNSVSYRAYFKDVLVLDDSKISLDLGAEKPGISPQVRDTNKTSADNMIFPVVKQKTAQIRDNYNEIQISFKGNYSLIFRVYDDGVTYRFKTELDGNITVYNENLEINFPKDYKVYFPEESSFFTHQERTYKYLSLSEISEEKMSSIPALVECEDNIKIVITEADLQDYPGFFIKGSPENSLSLKGIFPHYPLEVEQKNDRNVPVTKYAEYLVKTSGSREFPWRVLIITDKDEDIIKSQMVFKLASENKLENTDWIKPGKVAWDWWNANNIYGVDFKAGINTETYKYYIDFASKYDIEYIILDEGWYKLGDLFDINPEVDMEELTKYAESKNVGIILWVVWKTLDDQLHEALDQFEKWKIKGIKVDFMQRDDQWMVNYYYKIAEEAAKRKLLVDFHGSFKPSGLRRVYPNVLTREGVKGLEQSKWGDTADPENALIIPFTRMAAGPLDYTPGAMINATKDNFKPVFTKPMSQGTRCHQLAMYVVFESPLQMLADSPSNYYREPECMEFLSAVPTVWDDTRVLSAKVSDYVLIARRNGDSWYLGAMTDWTEREMDIDFLFLGEGKYTITIFQDGINANKNAGDYKKIVKEISKNDNMSIKLAPGGGWAAIISKSNK